MRSRGTIAVLVVPRRDGSSHRAYLTCRLQINRIARVNTGSVWLFEIAGWFR